MMLHPLPSGFDEVGLKAALTNHLDLTDPKEIERALNTIKMALQLGEGLFQVASNKEADRLEELRSHLQGALDAFNALSLPSVYALQIGMKDKSDGSDLHREGLFTTLTRLIETVEGPIELAKERTSELDPVQAEKGPLPKWPSIALAYVCSRIWLEYKHELKTSVTLATHLGMNYPKGPFGKFVEAVWHASAIGTSYEAAFKAYKKRLDFRPITRLEDR